MSDLLAAAAELLGAPSELVQKSAAARASADGVSVDDVLSAWTGGTAVPSAAPAESAPSPEPVVAEPEPAPVAEAPEPIPETPAAPEPQPIPAAAAVTAPTAVVTEPVVTEEPVEPVPLSDRLLRGGRLGALLGGFGGLLLVVFSAQWLLPRASVSGEEGAFNTVVEVVPGWFLFGTAIISAVVGLVIAGLSRATVGMSGGGSRLVSSPTQSLLIGGVSGFVLGLMLAALMLGFGEVSQLDESITIVPAMTGLITAVVGWVAAGWLVGVLVQALGVPAAVSAAEAEEAQAVRRRLVGAFGIPAVVVLAIVALVVPVGYLFIQFPGYAPLLGVFVAGSILAFAGLAASRPGRISYREFLVAAAGVAVVVILIVAVLQTQGAGHSEEEGEHGEEEATATVLMV